MSTIPFDDPTPELSDEQLSEVVVQALRAGERLGDSSAVLVMRLLSRIGPRHPAFGPTPGTNELFAFTGDFFVEKGDAWSARILALAPTSGQVIALTVTVLEDWLTDRWRQTAYGSVHHRVAQVLSAHPDFVRAGPGWWLNGDPAGQWDGQLEPLINAARKVNAPAVRWKSTSRRPPLTTREALIAVLNAVLEEAGGPLSLNVITAVCLERFPSARDPMEVSLELTRPEQLHAETGSLESVHDDVDQMHEMSEAIALVLTLTPEERNILRFREDPEALQRVLDVGRSQASAKRKTLQQRLLPMLNEMSDPHAVGAQLLPALDLLFPADPQEEP